MLTRRLVVPVLVASAALGACSQPVGTNVLSGTYEFAPATIYAIHSLCCTQGGHPGGVLIGMTDTAGPVNCFPLLPQVGGPALAFGAAVSDEDGGIYAGGSYAITGFFSPPQWGTGASSNILADAGIEVFASYTSGTVTFTEVTTNIVAGTFSMTGTAVDGGGAAMSGEFYATTMCRW
jgi:hypothetical protein